MTSPEQATEQQAFRQWWDTQRTNLGPAYFFTAWNAWQERGRLAAVALHPAPSEPPRYRKCGHLAGPSALCMECECQRELDARKERR